MDKTVKANFIITIVVYTVHLIVIVSIFGQNGVDCSDSTKIRSTVYQDLIHTYCMRPTTAYGALFLETTTNDISYMSMQITNLNSRLEFETNNMILVQGDIIDRITHKHSVYLWARVINISTNLATVSAGWKSSSICGMALRYEMHLESNKWTIESRKTVAVW